MLSHKGERKDTSPQHKNNEVDQGGFSPLVFTGVGGIGREGRAFYPRLATLLSWKNGIEKSKVASWIQPKVSFSLFRSMLLCLRGS